MSRCDCECLEVTTHVYTEVTDGDYGWLEVNLHVYTEFLVVAQRCPDVNVSV